MGHRRFVAEGALVVAALLFGSTFVLVQDALEDITPFAYLVLRFTIAVAVLAPFAITWARRDRASRRLLARAGLVAGALLFGGYAAQTVGLQYTTPSTSAFVTGLYVVFTPVVEAVVRRHRPPRSVVAGIGIATAGLFLLTGADLRVGRGEVLTLVCAVLFAVWIVYQGAFANRLHPVSFTAAQMVCVALLSLPFAAGQGAGELGVRAWFAVVFTGVACSAIALSLQLWGQRRIAPSRAALILLSEPVFAGIAGALTGEHLGPVRLVGAGVILAGIVLAEVAPGAAEVDAEDAEAEAELEARLH